MKNAMSGASLAVACAGALLTCLSIAVLAWNYWLSPLMGSGADVGGALLAGTVGQLWIPGLPVLVLGVAGWLITRNRVSPNS